MSEISTFESRTGRINSTPEDIFRFVTDIRNFEQFIPKNNISNLTIAKDSCSLDVSMLGKVNIHIGEKNEFSDVVFNGNASQINDFSLKINILDAGPSRSEAKLTLLANLNPFLKMIAAGPINNLLDKILEEMENFRGWKEIRRDS